MDLRNARPATRGRTKSAIETHSRSARARPFALGRGARNDGWVAAGEKHLIHLVVNDATSGDLKPLCGDWRGHPNWTTVPGCVTCPFCLERMRDRTA